MLLGRKTACQYFEIFAPRWHDRVVLLAAHKVGTHNKIIFTKAPTLQGEWYISGRDVHQCPLESNGKIACYAVKIQFLEPIEYMDDIWKELEKVWPDLKEDR
jgi:hypothetical protein